MALGDEGKPWLWAGPGEPGKAHGKVADEGRLGYFYVEGHFLGCVSTVDPWLVMT